MKLKKHIRKGKFGTEIYMEDLTVGGFTAFFNDFTNIVSQGETIKEAQNNLWNTAYGVMRYYAKKK